MCNFSYELEDNNCTLVILEGDLEVANVEIHYNGEYYIPDSFTPFEEQLVGRSEIYSLARKALDELNQT